MPQPRQPLGPGADHHVEFQVAGLGLDQVQHPAGDSPVVHQAQGDQQAPRRRLGSARPHRRAPGLGIGRRQQGVGGTDQDARSGRGQGLVVLGRPAKRRIDQQPAPMLPIGQIVDDGDDARAVRQALLVKGAKAVVIHHDDGGSPQGGGLAGRLHQAM